MNFHRPSHCKINKGTVSLLVTASVSVRHTIVSTDDEKLVSRGLHHRWPTGVGHFEAKS